MEPGKGSKNPEMGEEKPENDPKLAKDALKWSNPRTGQGLGCGGAQRGSKKVEQKGFNLKTDKKNPKISPKWAKDSLKWSNPRTSQ